MRRKGLFKVALAGEARGKVAADDKIVDIVNQVSDAGIELVEIGNDGDAGGACPARGHCGCGGFKSVHMQGTRIHDP